MEELKIGIIDDDSGKVTQIITKLLLGIRDSSPEKVEKYSKYKLTPHELELKEDLEDIVSQIKTLKLDCVLVDYKLSSYATIDYTGIECAKYIEDALYDFPVFILTSYEDDLFTKEIFNAYQVFDFERYLSDPLESNELNFKIIEQILKSRKQKEEWEKEIKKLIPLAGKSEEIDSRLLELDYKLEKSISSVSALPLKIRQDLNNNKLDVLLEQLDRIIEKE